MEDARRVLKEFLSRVRIPEARQRVKQKVMSGTCLLCDDPAEHGCRGLCEYHHGQHKYQRAKFASTATVTKEENRRGVTLLMKIKEMKDEFDDKNVRRGLILTSQQGKHGKPTSFRFTA